jgi:hypothetical protein
MAALLAGLAMLAVVLGAHPARAADPAAERVAELLEASGDRSALPRVVEALGKGVTAALSSFVEPRDAERIVGQTITVDRVFDRLVARASRDFEAERGARLLAWLRTPGAQRITQLELKGAEASDGEIAAYNARPDATPDAARTRLLERLEAVTHASELNVEAMLAIQRGLERGAAPDSARPPRRPSDTVVRSLVDAERSQVLAQQRYTYRELTTDELAAYVAVLEQDDHRWFGRVTRGALVEALETVCEDAARRTLGAGRRRAPEQRI